MYRPHNNPAKEALRKQLERDRAAFIANGGKVYTAKPGETLLNNDMSEEPGNPRPYNPAWKDVIQLW